MGGPFHVVGYRVARPTWLITPSVREPRPAVPSPADDEALEDGCIDLALTTTDGEDPSWRLGRRQAEQLGRALVDGQGDVEDEDEAWIVEQAPSGIWLTCADRRDPPDPPDIAILPTPRAEALGQALIRAAEDADAVPPWVLPDYEVDQIDAVPHRLAVEVLQGAPDVEGPRVQLIYSSHTWTLRDDEVAQLVDALTAAADAGADGLHLSWTEPSTFGGARPWCRVAREGERVVLTLVDELVEEDGQDGRTLLTVDAARALARAFATARAFDAANPPYVPTEPHAELEVDAATWPAG